VAPICWALFGCSSKKSDQCLLNFLSSFFSCALSVFDHPDQLQPLLNLWTFRFRSWIPWHTLLGNVQDLQSTIVTYKSYHGKNKLKNMLIKNHQSNAKYLCSFQHFSSVQNVRQKTAATCPSFAYKTYKFILIRHLTLNFLNKFNKISKCDFWRIKFVVWFLVMLVSKKIRGQISSLFYLVSRFSTRTTCTIKKLLLQFPLFPARLLFIRILHTSHLRDSANGALGDLVHQAQKLLSIIAFSKSTKKSQSKMVHHPPKKKIELRTCQKTVLIWLGPANCFAHRTRSAWTALPYASPRALAYFTEKYCGARVSTSFHFMPMTTLPEAGSFSRTRPSSVRSGRAVWCSASSCNSLLSSWVMSWSPLLNRLKFAGTA
jgi:hypothetical protein